MSGGGVPSPSAAETALTTEQAELLQMQQQMLQQQMATYDLLSPFLYSDLGLIPQYGMVANPEYTALQSRIADIDAQLAQTGGAPYGQPRADPYGIQPGAGFDPRAAQLQSERAALQSQLDAMAPEINQLTGFVEDPEQAEIRRLMEERQLSALRGDLPIDPSLTRTFEGEEQALRSRLLANLGPGYETSTPGMQSLAEFSARKTGIEYAARRGEIYDTSTLGSNLATQRLGNIFGTYGLPLGNFGAAGQLFQGYGSTLGSLFANRQLQAQARASSQASLASLFGTAAGIGLGMWAGGPAGAYAGGAAGGAAAGAWFP